MLPRSHYEYHPPRRSDDSVADALQFISYYHPLDYIQALGQAYSSNSRRRRAMPSHRSSPTRACARRDIVPYARIPGSSVVFLKIGMNVRWDASVSVEDMVNEGVRRAYLDPDNMLRASIVADPAGARKNTRDNTRR